MVVDLGRLEEYFETNKSGEICTSLSLNTTASTSNAWCWRGGAILRPFELTGLSALLLRTTIEDAVAVAKSTLASLGSEKPVDLLQHLDQSSTRAVAERQLVIDQMGIESSELRRRPSSGRPETPGGRRSYVTPDVEVRVPAPMRLAVSVSRLCRGRRKPQVATESSSTSNAGHGRSSSRPSMSSSGCCSLSDGDRLSDTCLLYGSGL